MTWRTGGRLVAPFMALALVVAACGGDDGGDDGDAASTSTTSSTSSVRPSTSTVPDGPVSILTGEPIDEADEAELAERSAVVVKVGNNDADSIPQTALGDADIVYEEHIEGQKTRFAAVFHTRIPPEVGPVRSGRLSDIDLVAELGTPLLAYSGGNPTVLGAFRNSYDAGVFVDVGELRLESLYYRSSDRRRPDNLYFTTDQVDLTQGGTPPALFTHGALPDDMGGEIGGIEVRYPNRWGRVSTHIWDEAANGWVRIQDDRLHTSLSGDDETEIAPANVVVAVTPYSVSPADPTQSPKAESFGTGDVFVFTRGRVVAGTWTRSGDAPGWRLVDAEDRPIPLAPGRTWVLLAAAEGSAFGSATLTLIDPTDAAVRLDAARAAFAQTAAE